MNHKFNATWVAVLCLALAACPPAAVPNNAPALDALTPVTVIAGQSATVELTATDADGDAVTFTLDPTTPAWATLSGTTLTLAPTLADVGTVTLTVLVADGKPDGSASGTLSVTVVASNAAPQLAALGAVAMDEGTTQTVTLAASDPDGDPLTFAIPGAPTWASLSGTTLTLSPGFNDSGVYSIAVEAIDPVGAKSTGTLDVTVANVNRAPVISAIAGITVAEGAVQTATLTATDPDGDAVTLSLVGAPAWASLSGTTLTLSPGYSDAGQATFTVAATDTGNMQSTAPVTVTVNGTNQAPTISPVSPVSMNEGDNVNVPLTGTDPDGDVLTFSMFSGPAWAQVSGSFLSLAPTFSAAGVYSIVVRVYDGQVYVPTTVSVTVANVNRPPVLSAIATVAMSEGQSVGVTLVASDPDGDTLQYSIPGAPAWATISGNTVTLAPVTGNNGNYALTAMVQDPGLLSDSKLFTVTVAVTNTPPSLSGPAQFDGSNNPIPIGNSVASAVTLKATTTDAQGDNVKLEAEVTTGAFSGTPTHSGTLAAPGLLSLPLGSLAAGSYKWRIRAVDALGLPSAWSPFNGGATAFVVPAQAITGTIAVNAGQSVTNNQTVAITLSLSPTGGNTLTTMQFSNDDVTYSAPEAYATSKPGWSLSAGSGSKTVYAKVTDSAANIVTFSDTIVYDADPPTISFFAVNGGAAYVNNAAVVLTFTASDGLGSGIQKIEASNDGITWTVVASPANWNLAGVDGPKTVSLRATDNAGNPSAISPVGVYLDTAAPSISAISINSGALNTIDPLVSIVSTVSGTPTEIAFSNDGVAYGAFQPLTTPNAYVLPAPDGTKTVWAKVRDQALNVSLTAAQASIMLDTAPPSGSFAINAGDLYTTSQTVALTVSASDGSGSGVVNMCMKNGAVQPSKPGVADPCWVSYATSVPSWNMGAGSGPRYVWAWFRDNAGLVSAVTSDSITLDATPPTVPSGITYSVGVRSITMNWSAATDAISGIQGYQVGIGTSSGNYTFLPITGPLDLSQVVVAINGTPLGNGTNYYVVVRAVDNAGNPGAVSSPEVSATPHFAWAYRQRGPAGVILRATKMYSASAGLAMGEGGASFITTNGWANSIRVDPLFDATVNGLGTDTGGGTVAVGAGGNIAYSGNDGLTWKLGTNNQANPKDLYAADHVQTTSDLVGTYYAYVAVGDNGTILRGNRSVTGFGTGMSLTPVNSGSVQNLRSVAKCGAVGSQIVIAVGSAGTILRSADNGASWGTVTPPSGYANAAFRAVAAIPGTNTMYIGGLPASSVAPGTAALLKSINAGVSWTEVAGFDAVAINGLAAFSTTLWAAASTYTWCGVPLCISEGSDSKVVKWNGSTATFQTPPAGVVQRPYSVHAFDANNVAWVGNAGQIATTANASTWTDRSAGLTDNFNAFGLVTNASGNGWAVGTSGVITHTTTNGATWTEETNSSTSSLFSVAAPTVSFAFAVGSAGTIVQYNSGTTSWAPHVNSGIVAALLRGVDCVSTSECWAVGNGKAVLRYNGANWTVSNYAAGSPQYYAIRTVKDGSNVTRGIAVGASGSVRTLSGTTWTEQAALAGSPTLTSVDLTAAGVALAVGTNGALYKSVDYGISWALQAPPLGITAMLTGVRHEKGSGGTSQIWYIAGASGTALRTTNDGGNWTQLKPGAVSTFNGIAEYTSSVYLVGSNGLVLYSAYSGG